MADTTTAYAAGLAMLGDSYFTGTIDTKWAVPYSVFEDDGMSTMQQVNGRLLISYPAAAVFEFRAVRPGTLTKIKFFSPNTITEDCKFDINVGPTRVAATSIYIDPDDRPTIQAGQYTVESVVSVSVNEGDLISVDIDEANEQLKGLTVVATIEADE